MSTKSKNKKEVVGKKIVAAKKTKAVKEVKAKSSPKEKVNNVDIKEMNEFRQYCYKKNITQQYIRDNTYLSIGVVNRLINHGGVSKSVVHHISLFLDIPFEELETMLSNKL